MVRIGNEVSGERIRVFRKKKELERRDIGRLIEKEC